jgi:hypothetical protein
MSSDQMQFSQMHFFDLVESLAKLFEQNYQTDS